MSTSFNPLPLVTIGAINYNNAKYVVETLESIQAQTYPNIELIVVDDCSTDSSPQLIEDWLKTYDKPYKFIRHEKNKGVCATCNSVVRHASGGYYSYVATDDILLPDKVTVQVKELQEAGSNAGVVFSDAFMINEDGRLRPGRFIQWQKDFDDVPCGEIFQDLLEVSFIPPMTALVKNECFDKAGLYDESLKYEDFDMWLRIARHYKFVFSDYVSAKYRRRNDGLTKTIKNWNPTNIKIYLKHTDHPAVIHNLRWYAKKVYTEGDWESYKLLVASAVCKDPFIKTTLRLMKLRVPGPLGRRLLNRLFPYTAGWWY